MTGYFDNATLADGNDLTAFDILKAIQAMRETITIWYATTEYIEEGNILKCVAHNGYPECLVIHENDLPMLKAQYPVTWRHIREWRE